MNGRTVGGGISRGRFIAALSVAVVSDALSIWTEFVPPVQWGLDVATALALFMLLGWRWQILPGLVAEAIPGLAALPFWVMVVAAIYAVRERRPVNGEEVPETRKELP